MLEFWMFLIVFFLFIYIGLNLFSQDKCRNDLLDTKQIDLLDTKQIDLLDTKQIDLLDTKQIDLQWEIIILTIIDDELPMLDKQLTELYDQIDHFVICEADTTFSGKSKPYFVETNKNKYVKWEDKMTILSLKIPENCVKPEQRRKHQVEMLMKHIYKYSTRTIFVFCEIHQILSKDSVYLLKNNVINEKESRLPFKIPLDTYYFTSSNSQSEKDVIYAFRALHVNMFKYQDFHEFIMKAPLTTSNISILNSFNGWSFKWFGSNENIQRRLENSSNFLQYKDFLADIDNFKVVFT
jgi:hypothetical protein